MRAARHAPRHPSPTRPRPRPPWARGDSLPTSPSDDRPLLGASAVPCGGTSIRDSGMTAQESDAANRLKTYIETRPEWELAIAEAPHDHMGAVISDSRVCPIPLTRRMLYRGFKGAAYDAIPGRRDRRGAARARLGLPDRSRRGDAVRAGRAVTQDRRRPALPGRCAVRGRADSRNVHLRGDVAGAPRSRAGPGPGPLQDPRQHGRPDDRAGSE